MGNYIYKCVSLQLGLGNEINFLEDTVHSYEKKLNDAAKDGWDFVKTDTITPLQQENNYTSSVAVDVFVTKILIFKKYVIAVDEKQRELNFVFNETMVNCPSCNNEVSEDDIFCENCAAKLR